MFAGCVNISFDCHCILCVRSGPPGSRCLDTIKSVRDLLKEIPGKGKGKRRGSRSRQGGPLSTVQVWQPGLGERRKEIRWEEPQRVGSCEHVSMRCWDQCSSERSWDRQKWSASSSFTRWEQPGEGEALAWMLSQLPPEQQLETLV